MKETDEIMGLIKEEGAAYFARERGNKVEVGIYLERLIEERGMKKKDIVRFSFLLIWRIHKGFWISVRSPGFIRVCVTMQRLFTDWKKK